MGGSKKTSETKREANTSPSGGDWDWDSNRDSVYRAVRVARAGFLEGCRQQAAGSPSAGRRRAAQPVYLPPPHSRWAPQGTHTGRQRGERGREGGKGRQREGLRDMGPDEGEQNHDHITAVW